MFHHNENSLPDGLIRMILPCQEVYRCLTTNYDISMLGRVMLSNQNLSRSLMLSHHMIFPCPEVICCPIIMMFPYPEISCCPIRMIFPCPEVSWCPIIMNIPCPKVSYSRSHQIDVSLPGSLMLLTVKIFPCPEDSRCPGTE